MGIFSTKPPRADHLIYKSSTLICTDQWISGANISTQFPVHGALYRACRMCRGLDVEKEDRSDYHLSEGNRSVS